MIIYAQPTTQRPCNNDNPVWLVLVFLGIFFRDLLTSDSVSGKYLYRPRLIHFF